MEEATNEIWEIERAELKQKIAELEEKNHALQVMLEKKDERVQNLQERLNVQIKDDKQQLMQINAEVNEVLHTGEELVDHKVFRLVHFYMRLRSQLIGGSWSDRRDFLRWIGLQLRGKGDSAHRFNPLYLLLDPICRISERLNDALTLVDINDALLLDEETKHCLESHYEKPDVIVLSVIGYHFRFQRPQHFAKRFAQNGHRVFYINPDFCNVEAVKEEFPGLYTVDYMTTKLQSVYFTEQWDGFESWMQRKLDALVRLYAIRDAIVILDYPTWITCAEHLRDAFGFRLVADYMDDTTGFLGTTTDSLKANSIQMLESCDMVIPSSQFLCEIAQKHTDRLTIVRNGTEVEHFQKAAEMEAKHSRPVIGYYGAISHWFAWEKVCYLAEHLPECDIVLIGDVTAHREKLEKHSNIKLLGEMKYQNLPEHLAYFDVCLIPFDTSTDLIKATNPVKFYEYLSAGKRIVATEIPELEPFKDHYVYMTNDDARFLEYVKLCLAGKDTLSPKEECIRFALENDWQHRYDAFAAACGQAFPKVSVVVLTYNNLKLNRYCIDSVLHQTGYPNYELVVLDNQSTDGTVAYLHELEQQHLPHLRIIFNEENSGFAGGNNKAIETCTDSKYIVLLNNDTVVTRGWMSAMVKHMEADPKCGMIGAVTNSIGNGAMIDVEYRNLREMAQFAYQYTSLHNNECYRDVDRIALFGTIIRKEIMDQYGMLDTGYKVGMFEDDDFAMTVSKAGYRFYVIDDCFIHHVNNASFRKLHPEEYRKIFNANKARYEEKWNTSWTLPTYRKGIVFEHNKGFMTEPVE